jgi:hypothetical protein
MSDERIKAAVRLAEAYTAHEDALARGWDAIKDGSYGDGLRELEEAEAAWRTLAKPEPAPHVGIDLAAGPDRTVEAVVEPGKVGGTFFGVDPCDRLARDMAEIAKAAAALDTTEPAPKCPEPCPACGTFDGKIERIEGDHLGAVLSYEPCPRCAKGGSHD